MNLNIVILDSTATDAIAHEPAIYIFLPSVKVGNLDIHYKKYKFDTKLLKNNLLSLRVRYLLRELPVFKSYCLQPNFAKLNSNKIIFSFICSYLCHMSHGLKGILRNMVGRYLKVEFNSVDTIESTNKWLGPLNLVWRYHRSRG